MSRRYRGKKPGGVSWWVCLILWATIPAAMVAVALALSTTASGWGL